MAMTDIDIDLPADWTERANETQRASALVEYQHTTDDQTKFIVTLLKPASDDGDYRLRLSIVNTTSAHVRHDYPVDEYDTREVASAATEAFIECLDRRLAEGAISPADPEIDEIRNTIADFTGVRLFPSVRQLIPGL